MKISAQCSSLGKIIISTVANWHEGSRQCASRKKMQIVLIPSTQCCVHAKGWTHNSGPNRSKNTDETETHALQNHIKPHQKHYELILSWCSWNSKPYEFILFWCSWSSKSHWFIAFWSSWNSEPCQFITCWSSWKLQTLSIHNIRKLLKAQTPLIHNMLKLLKLQTLLINMIMKL